MCEFEFILGSIAMVRVAAGCCWVCVRGLPSGYVSSLGAILLLQLGCT